MALALARRLARTPQEQRSPADLPRPMPADDALIRETLARLGVLEAEVCAMRQRLTALEQRHPRLAPVDHAELSRILPVVAATFGSEAVKVSELFGSRAPGLRLVIGSLSRGRVGRLFARAEGLPIGDLVVVRLGIEAGAVLWQIGRV